MSEKKLTINTEDLDTALPEGELEAEGPFDSDLTQDATPFQGAPEGATEEEQEPEVGDDADVEPVSAGDPGRLAAATIDAYRSRPAE